MRKKLGLKKTKVMDANITCVLCMWLTHLTDLLYSIIIKSVDVTLVWLTRFILWFMAWPVLGRLFWTLRECPGQSAPAWGPAFWRLSFNRLPVCFTTWEKRACTAKAYLLVKQSPLCAPCVRAGMGDCVRAHTTVSLAPSLSCIME